MIDPCIYFQKRKQEPHHSLTTKHTQPYPYKCLEETFLDQQI